MDSTPDKERKIVALLRQRANVEVANLSWLTSLPTPDYRRALAVLDAAMGHEIQEPVQFIAKLCFSDRRASAYYRRIYEWWSVARGDTEPLSLEGALCRTFSKSQCPWTWPQLQKIPVQRWPVSIVRRMWTGDVPRDQIRPHLLGLLASGECKLYMLAEIARIDDSQITAWFRTQPNLPRLVRRALPNTTSPQPQSRYLTAKELAAVHELFSAEIDEDNAAETITELAFQVVWPPPGLRCRHRQTPPPSPPLARSASPPRRHHRL